MDARRRPVRPALAAAALLVAAGCVSPPPPMYAWDGYEDSLYRLWVESEDFDAAGEAHRLAAEIEQAHGAGLAVPPGVHAHLAMLCAKAGDAGGAEANLLAEKAEFPESAVFVDGMLARMRR